MPGEVVVRYAPSARAASAGEPVTAAHARGADAPGQTVAEKAAALRRRPGRAERDAELHRARELHPERPGPRRHARRLGAGSSGTSSARSASTRPAAWDNVAAVGRSGAAGVTVAVLDTGVAYSDRGPFTRSPDLRGNRFVRGYDFVDDDPYPNDLNGHGTHVASTIAESIDNGVGVTGLAFGAQDHAGAGARPPRRGRQRARSPRASGSRRARVPR